MGTETNQPFFFDFRSLPGFDRYSAHITPFNQLFGNFVYYEWLLSIIFFIKKQVS